jgi:DNA repair protein RecO (recombination protein O)
LAGKEVTDTGFVLHRRRLRETSLLLELFTHQHGRVGVVARGATQGRKGGQPPLEFALYHLAWSGTGELPRLLRAEPAERAFSLTGERLFSALYMNELLMRLLQRGEGDALAFAAYQQSLLHLANGHPLEPVLRHFEALLLEACGYGMQLAAEGDTGLALEAADVYCYAPERGALRQAPNIPHRAVHGGTLLALAGKLPWDESRLREAKGLMRFLLQPHLGGRPLAARALFGLAHEDQT